jgi:hypothetical protein
MKKNLIVLVMMMWSSGVLWSQETWVKTFGGSERDEGYFVTPTNDGGYILTGGNISYDGDFEGEYKGGFTNYKNIFIIKIDNRGNVQWKKVYGGDLDDEGHSVLQTPDGGYLLSGGTKSNSGDFEGMYKGYFNVFDIFVIKLDSRGNLQWKKVLGGTGTDLLSFAAMSSDGGYLLIGNTESDNGDFSGLSNGSYKNFDVFVLKLNDRGDVQSTKLYGGTNDDEVIGVSRCPDGGFVLTGRTDSYNGLFEGMSKGRHDIFVMKLDSKGYLRSTTNVDEPSFIISSFSITPNPLSPLSTVSYSLDKPSHVRIEVVNSIGEVVSVLSDKQVDVGSHQIPFNTTHLVTGTYSVRLVENNRVTSKRVVQIK